MALPSTFLPLDRDRSVIGRQLDRRLDCEFKTASTRAFSNPTSVAPRRATMQSSPPIKIPNQPQDHDSDEATLEQEQDMMVQLADQVDYLFYSRVLMGVQRRNSEVRGLESFFENQRCLENIIRTRRSDEPAKKAVSAPQPTLKKSPSTRMVSSMPLSLAMLHNVENSDTSRTDRESDDDDHVDDESDDDFIFDLDL